MKISPFLFGILICLILTYNTLSAQSVVGDPNQYETTWRQLQKIRNLLNTQNREYKTKIEDVKGSPYLNSNFQIGQFILNDSIVGEFMIRYNMYSDEFEVLKENTEINFANEQEYEAILKLNGSKFILNNGKYLLFHTLNERKEIKPQYFLELYKGNTLNLYERNYSIFTPAEKALNFNQADRAARFSTYTTFHTKNLKDDQLIELPSNKKLFLEKFSIHRRQLTKFFKENRINLKNRDDIKSIIRYIDNLKFEEL